MPALALVLVAPAGGNDDAKEAAPEKVRKAKARLRHLQGLIDSGEDFDNELGRRTLACRSESGVRFHLRCGITFICRLGLWCVCVWLIA